MFRVSKFGFSVERLVTKVFVTNAICLLLCKQEERKVKIENPKAKIIKCVWT